MSERSEMDEQADLYFCPEVYAADANEGRVLYHNWNSTVTLVPGPAGQIGVKVISMCSRCRALAHDARADLGPLQVKYEGLQLAPKGPPTPPPIVVAQGNMPRDIRR